MTGYGLPTMGKCKLIHYLLWIRPHQQVLACVIGVEYKPTSSLMIHVAACEETLSNLSAVVLTPLSELANNTLECYGLEWNLFFFWLYFLSRLPLLFLYLSPATWCTGGESLTLMCSGTAHISETNAIQPPTVWLAARGHCRSCVEFITEPTALSGV